MSTFGEFDGREKFGDLGENDEWRKLFETDERVLKSGECGASPSKQVEFDVKGSQRRQKAPPDHLDLYNFDEPGTEESRYVLTSPRSLEACARFGIKPVELLFKAYEEFLDEYRALYDTNYSHEAILEVFQEHERQRKRKLKLCREERERIVQEQGRRDSDAIIGEFTQSNQITSHKSRKSNTDSPEKFSYRNENVLNSMANSQSTPNLHNQTRTRQTERTTNGYHTTESSDNVARQPPSGKPKIVKSQSFSFRDAKTRGETSDSDAGETCMSPQVRRVRSQWSVPKNTSEPSSPVLSPRAPRRSSNASTNSSNSAFGKKPPKRVMSTECVLSAVGGKRVSQKDQRIIDLMLSRHEEAQRLRDDRMVLDVEWDEQKKLDNDLRQARERQRRAEIYEQYTAKDAKQYQARARRIKTEIKTKLEKEDVIRSKQAAWEQEKEKQKRIKENQIQLKRLTEVEKKRQQEENRLRKEREDEMARNMSYLSLLDKHERAIHMRNMQVKQEQLKLKIRNETEKLRIAEKKERVARQSREEKESIREQINEKHLRALENYESQLEKRDSEIRQSKRKKVEKVQRQREELHRMESELSDWQKNLKAYREESLKRAEAVASMNVAKKQMKTRTHLVAKKQEHAENYERVKEDDDRRKREIEQDLEVKDERSQMVNAEKEEIRKMSREAAVTSQAVRDIVKEQTFKSSFDSMAHKAQVQAKVGRGPQTGHKNQSNIRLG